MKKTETTSTVLLKHHLKALRLPTILSECDKVAARCATENVDHLGFCIRQKLFTPSFVAKFESRLKAIAMQHQEGEIENPIQSNIAAELAAARAELELVGRNLALADGPEQHHFINKQFVLSQAKCKSLEAKQRQISPGKKELKSKHV